MPSRFAAVTNKEIWKLIKQAVPKMHEEGDEALSFWLEFIDKTQKEFKTPFEEISPQELNKCLQKFYWSARKSDDRGRSVIARQNVIAGNGKWVKNHIFVLSHLTVLVYILLAEYITIMHLSVGGSR